MNKLLHADLYRMKKNKGFRIGLGAVGLFCIILIGSNYREMVKYDIHQETVRLLFQFLSVTGIVMAAVVSLFVGTDYRDGTIRNKIVAGCGRKQMYLSGFAACAVMGAGMYLVGLGICLALDIPLFGGITMDPGLFCLLLADGLLLHIAYAAALHLISILVSRREYSAVVCILLMVVLLVAASYLLSRLSEPEMTSFAQITGESGDIALITDKNPHYVSGVKREIYQLVLDVLPTGQAAELASMSAVHPVRMLLGSLAVTVLCLGSGMWFFEKKDIR